jgi:hypothetical protein
MQRWCVWGRSGYRGTTDGHLSRLPQEPWEFWTHISVSGSRASICIQTLLHWPRRYPLWCVDSRSLHDENNHDCTFKESLYSTFPIWSSQIRSETCLDNCEMNGSVEEVSPQPPWQRAGLNTHSVWPPSMQFECPPPLPPSPTTGEDLLQPSATEGWALDHYRYSFQCQIRWHVSYG